ncbi:MAG TPA: hypothetical protein VME45_03070 [Stellaceae bacterium]|nr:hypothetical protein [Stellaceae bacterium]
MSYDPFERRPTAREIVAAWVICLGIAGLGLALTVGREAPATATAARALRGTAHDPEGMAGVRLPGAHPAPAEPNPLVGSRFQPTQPKAAHHSSSA